MVEQTRAREDAEGARTQEAERTVREMAALQAQLAESMRIALAAEERERHRVLEAERAARRAQEENDRLRAEVARRDQVERDRLAEAAEARAAAERLQAEVARLRVAPQPSAPASHALVHYSGAEVEAAIAAGRVVGVGGFGDVTRGVLRGADVAIKVIQQLTPETIRTFQRELDVQGNLRHERILPILGSCMAPMCLVSPFLDGGDLNARLEIEDPAAQHFLTGPMRVEVVRQVLEGLAFFHENGVVHGDISPRNIFFAADGGIKLADAGLSVPLPEGRSHLSLSRMGGTRGYFDPEAASQARPARDMYSVGVLIIEMVTGSLPGDSRAVTRTLSNLAQRLNTFWYDVAWESPRDDESASRLVELAKICVGPSHTRPTSAAALRLLSTEPTVSLPGDDAEAVRECQICLSNPRQVMFLPCRHAVSCEVCAVRLMERRPPTCPTCRATIRECVRGNFNVSFVPP